MTYTKAAVEAAPKCAASDDAAQLPQGLESSSAIEMTPAIVAAAVAEATWLARLQRRWKGPCDHCGLPGRAHTDIVGKRAHSGFLCTIHRARVPQASEPVEVLVARVQQAGQAMTLDRVLCRVAPYLRRATVHERLSGIHADAVVLVARVDGSFPVTALTLDFAPAGMDLASAMPRPAPDEIDRGEVMRTWATAAALGKCKRYPLATLREGVQHD